MITSIDRTRLKLTSEQGTEGVLVGTRCGDCGTCSFGPAILCQKCTSSALQALELSSRGVLYSYTVVHVPPAGWPGRVPYVLGQVELDDGPHVLAEVVDCPWEDLKVGMAMVLTLETVAMADSDEQKAVYKFRAHSEGSPK